MSDNNKSKISLFIPCLVDQVYPEIGIDMAKILDHLGYQVVYNNQQTCCGQPAFNAGHRDEARKVASKFIEVFSSSDVIVSPSGSCTAMIKNYYPTLFANDPIKETAYDLGRRTFEFSSFLAHEDQIKNITGIYSGKVGFHNSCHSLRELGIEQEPLKILKNIKDMEIIQPSGDPVCCGFGGLFSFKFDEISATMAKTRIEAFTSLGVDTIVSNDPGCLMHMRQEAIDRHYELDLLHLTEFLARALNL
jgi:L-lactate dehydrogenase complex protein LldE